MGSDHPSIISKSEFARLSGVDPARVTQWIKDRKLTGDALVGTGRLAKINVPIAQRQLRRTLDPNQMTANGSATDLGAKPVDKSARPSIQAAQPDAGPKDDDATGSGVFDLTNERARLAAEQADATAMRNAERRGTLIDAAEAEALWTAEVIDMRTRTLRVIDDLRTEMPELTPAQVSRIDRLLREAMHRASQGDG